MSGRGFLNDVTKLASRFFSDTREARKVLILDLGFLGDTVHLLPAAWAIRQAYLHAELSVMVAENVTSILQLTPWIDRVWGYPRFPKGPKPWQDLRRVMKLRREKFDAVINFVGSDRTSLLTRLSGARARLGRRPRRGTPLHWRFLVTHEVDHPYGLEPVYAQRWACSKKAGFPGVSPEFRITISEAMRAEVARAVGSGRPYFHVSPCTPQDLRQLPLSQLAELLNRLTDAYPKMDLVLSCAPNERERSRVDALLPLLHQAPLRTFSGSLDLPRLAALIAGSQLHLGGDSGALHLAQMTQAPAVAWFRRFEGLVDWKPIAPQYRCLIGEETPQGIEGIDTNALFHAADELLKASVSARV